MACTINTFTNVRVRLFCVNSHSFLGGWVKYLSREVAHIELSEVPYMNANDPIEGECYGQGSIARFKGRLRCFSDSGLVIDIEGTISYAPSQEPPRVIARGIRGTLTTYDSRSPIELVDVSPASLAILCDCELPVNSEVTFNINTEMGPVEASATVINSRVDEAAGKARIALRLVDMGRLDRARWDRLVTERAAA